MENQIKRFNEVQILLKKRLDKAVEQGINLILTSSFMYKDVPLLVGSLKINGSGLYNIELDCENSSINYGFKVCKETGIYGKQHKFDFNWDDSKIIEFFEEIFNEYVDKVMDAREKYKKMNEEFINSL